MAGEAPRDGVRASALALIADALGRAAPAAEPGLARAIEEACHRRASAPGQPRFEYLTAYAEAYRGACAALGRPHGPFLAETLGAAVARGAVAPEALAAPEARGPAPVDPRRRARAALYSVLRAGGLPEERCRDYATRAEHSVYNVVIRHCQTSEASYTRRWTSPMFVNIYSARLGALLANLDPAGLVARALRAKTGGAGGSWALGRLAAGELEPEALGGMTATELCPPAGEAERAFIALRLEQKVTEKTSALFKCPKCGARRHTYRQVQIGAGDEISTFMCTCKECGEEYEGQC